MRVQEGLGLGLAIVKAAAEAHGGELLLLDARPSGLHAQLRLPIRAERDFAGTLQADAYAGYVAEAVMLRVRSSCK